jgi:phage baseplate assembly protein V
VNSDRFDITELARRVANMVMIGTVAEADYDAARVKIRMGDIVTAWLPWTTGRAGGDRTWHAPEVGEQMLLVSPSGNPAQAVILGSIFQDAHPAPGNLATRHVTEYADGAVIEYDREAHHLKAILPGGATTELISDGGIEFTGNLKVNGNIEATGHVKDAVRTMAADRTIYNGHVHGGVASGSSSTSTTGQTQ